MVVKNFSAVAADEESLRRLRDAFGAFATGVAVITTRSAAGLPIGVTVNSFASLSLDPPLVMWALNAGSPSLAAFQEARCFAVNVLATSQAEVAARFASRVPQKFAGIECFEGGRGLPLIAGCLAHLECRLRAEHEGGDHALFVGEVERFAHHPGFAPLIFHRGVYCALHSSPGA